ARAARTTPGATPRRPTLSTGAGRTTTCATRTAAAGWSTRRTALPTAIDFAVPRTKFRPARLHHEAAEHRTLDGPARSRQHGAVAGARFSEPGSNSRAEAAR